MAYAAKEVADGERDETLGALNHVGIQVASTDDVLVAKERLVAAGLAAFDETDTTCCYARHDKIWVSDPDGTPWEVFITHQDVDHERSSGPDLEMTQSAAQPGRCGCT